MENFFLGEYIKQRREALGLTQRQVCEGICTPVTLSRIENGTQTPSRTRINAILQRLGLPDDRYISLLSKNELKIEALKKEIVACNVTERVKEGREKLARLEELEGAADPLVQQFILRSRVLLGSVDGSCPPEKQIELLLKAIRLTVPRFDLGEIEQFLYATDEIKIINQMGVAFSDNQENEKAAVLYEQLLRYVRAHHQETITSVGVIPLVLYIMPGCWTSAAGMRRGRPWPGRGRRLALDMDIICICLIASRSRQSAAIFWDRTKKAPSCIIRPIICARLSGMKPACRW